MVSFTESLYLLFSHSNAVDDLWFYAENTRDACIPMSLGRPASHPSPELATWESAWMTICVWQ